MMKPSQQLDAPTHDISLGEIWNLLRRQRWVILGCLVLCLAAGLGIALSRKPVYEAAALIRVDDKRASLPVLEVLDARPTGNQIATEIEVLRSRALAAAVVDSLQLQLQITKPAGAARSGLLSFFEAAPNADSSAYRLVREEGRFAVLDAGSGARVGTVAPGERIQLGGANIALNPAATQHPEIGIEIRSRRSATDELAEALDVKQTSREANIIRVRYQGADPELVRDVPNVLADRFLTLRRGVQRAESGSTAAFLRQQLDTLSAQLTSAENQLQNFREQAQVIDPQVEGSTQVARLAQLQAERGALEAERSSLAQLLREVQASGPQRPGAASPYRRLLAFPSLLRNQSTSELLRSLSGVENDRAALLARRDPSDPDVQILTGRINELEDQLQATVTTYLQALTSQVAAIDANLAQFQQQLNRIPANEVQLARLSRRSKALEEIHGSLQTRLKEVEVSQAAEDPSIRVVDAAELPVRPASRRRGLILGLSALFGLVLGVGAGFVREYMDGSVRSRGDLQVATGVPVLGLIPRMHNLRVSGARLRMLPGAVKRLPAASGHKAASGATQLARFSDHSASSLLIASADSPNPLSDAYDRLHTNILFARPDTEAKTLLFTSALPADGKTTNATNFAITLVQRGLKVLLIDADLRRGAVASLFSANREPGLTEALNGSAPLAKAIRKVEVGGGGVLHLITTGRFPANPAQLLGSPKMAALLEQLERQYDKIILDSPPLNIVADAAVLASNVDGVIIVARAGATPFEALVYAAEQFRNANMPVLGTLLNDIDFERDASYDGAYRWHEYGKSYYSTAE